MNNLDYYTRDEEFVLWMDFACVCVVADGLADKSEHPCFMQEQSRGRLWVETNT